MCGENMHQLCIKNSVCSCVIIQASTQQYSFRLKGKRLQTVRVSLIFVFIRTTGSRDVARREKK